VTPHCARCDFHPTDDPDVGHREQLAFHAAESAHPLCVCCARSLVRGEAGTCETREPGDGTPCLTTAREHLSGIRTLYDSLSSHLGHLRGPSLDSDRPNATDGRPLPGGEVLVLLAGGNEGGAARPLTATEQRQSERWWVKGAVGPLTQAGVMAAERERTGREHVIDNLATDGLSVHGLLTSWESDWRESFDDPSRDLAGSTDQQTRRANKYIEIQMRRASREHSAFDEFVNDLRRLEAALRRNFGDHRSPRKANARCLDCRGELIVPLCEDVVEQTVTPHQWWLPGRIGPLPPPSVWRWRGQVEESQIVCEQCHRSYTPAAYALALRAALEAERERLAVVTAFEASA